MNEAKEMWIRERTEWIPFKYDPIRSQKIENVRREQERAIERLVDWMSQDLERFRETMEQDELEVAEFERLVREAADKLFPSA
jgi:hypothetical protein